MSRAELRGRARAGRRVVARRLTISPPKNRRGLLLSTALRGGALVDFGAELSRPASRPRWLSTGTALAAGVLGGAMLFPANGALAACSTQNAWVCTTPNNMSKTGAGPEAALTPTAGFTVDVGQLGGTANTYTDTANFNTNNLGAIVINDGGGYSGTITVRNTSKLQGDKADALRFYTTGTGSPDIIFNINGTLYGGNDAAPASSFTASPGDGLHVGQDATHAPAQSTDGSIGNLTVNVGNVNNRDAVVRGADDGIEIAQNITTLVTLTNYGTINGFGRKGSNTGVVDADNWGEGVHISTVDAGYGAGYQIDGAATLSNFGIIVGHQNTGSEGDEGAGSGVNISAKGAITIANTVINPPGPISLNDGPGSIRGTDGVVAYGDGSHDISLTNNGHIQGDLGTGADLSHAKNIVAENHTLGSMIGATNGIVLHDAETASYDNSSGLTAGQSGNGVVIHDIKGVTSGELPQYNITVDNTKNSEGDSGGIIVGQSSGVSMYGNDYSVSYAPGTNGVLLDNSGEGTTSEGDAGGLIVGINGNGVEITGTNGDVKVDNSYTRNGAQNDLAGTSAIDSLVGYSTNGEGDSLLDQTVSEGSGGEPVYGLNTVLDQPGAPSSLANGITTGIWGYGWGVYQENIGGTATIDNTYGQIFGKTGDGIKLSQIGGSITTPVGKVVDIDNSHGLIEGGNDAVKLSSIQHGGVSFNNKSGIALGGANGVEMDGVGGNVDVQNQSGLLGGYAGAGALISSVDGVASYENEGGVTFGLSGNGITISNVGGADGEGDNAVAVYNGAGGLIAGSSAGVEISNVTGDATEGDAVDVLVDNSGADIGEGDYTPGGLIIGLGGAGVSIHDIVPTDSEGEAGTVTVDNRYTGHSNYDLAGLGNADIYSEGDPSTGLLGSFADLRGETPTSGIYGTIGVYGSNIAGNVIVLNQEGLIVGSDGGVSLSEVGGDVDIHNERISESGNGGTIAGTSYGVDVTDVDGGLTVNNDYGSITANATSGTSYGVHGQNIGGKAGVDNSYGTISASEGDGINLTSIGGNLTLPVDHVVDIDNSNGTVTGGTAHNGATIATILNGGVQYNNNGGDTTGAVRGIDINSVAGSVYVTNTTAGVIKGGSDTGLSINDVDQTVTLDNEGGVTYSLGTGKNAVTISNVAGTDSEGDNAVTVYNGKGGIMAGAKGVEISNVTGDGSEGDASDILVDNSAKYLGSGQFSTGGIIVGVGGVGYAGVDIHDIGPTDSEGDAGTVTIDNRRTRNTSIDFADLANSDIYSEGDPSTGLLGTFVDDHEGTQGIVGSGIYGYYGVSGANIDGKVVVENQDGLIDATFSGVKLDTVGGDVEIDNGRTWRGGDGGLITAYTYGLQLDNIGGNLTVDNSHGTITATRGSGTIYGISGNHIDGTVGIDNTRGEISTTSTASFGIHLVDTGAITLTNKGGLVASEGDGSTAVYVSEGDSLTVDNTRAWRGGDGGRILGGKYGVYADISGTVDIDNRRGLIGTGSSAADDNGAAVLAQNITGDLTVDNARGVIFGAADGDYGVYGNSISGHVDIDNGSYQVDPGQIEDYGLIAGAVGISLANVGNGIGIDNSRGVVYGHEQGIVIDQTAGDGDITIDNSAGMIEGYLQNGIKITTEDSVTINNGNEHGGVITGGINATGGSAVDVAAFSVLIGNGSSWVDPEAEGDTTQGGLIVGAGDGPVISLTTSSSRNGGAVITNNGIIAALGANPYRYTDDNTEGDGGPEEFVSDLGDVTLPITAGLPLSNDMLPSEAGLAGIYADADAVKDFALNNVNGSIDNLANYADVASHKAIQSRTGSAWVYNDPGAIIFGTVDMTGATAPVSGDTSFGNGFWNAGTWFTQGMNTLTGAGADFITNGGGLIQTAFGGSSEQTTFDVADFYNADAADSESDAAGVLSSVDGDATDTTTITGNFYGTATLNDGGYGAGASLIALDANLDSSDGSPAADLVHISGNAYGTTGLIINNLNTNGISSGNTDGIKVVEVAGADAMRCVSVACQYGDTFYISSQSANYLEVNGRGTIQDGMFAWYLTEEDNNPDPDYLLKTAALPTADQAPELVTAFAHIFYDSGDVVSDHLEGGQMGGPGQGGGGADPSDSSKLNAAIWGKASGSWSQRDTTVESTAFGTVDTGLNQNTYTLLGGIDMSPNSDGEGMRFGLFGGYAESKLTFDAYAATGDYSGGVVGGYAAYVKNDFYANAQISANIMNMEFNAPFAGGVSGSSDGTTIGVIANVGKRIYEGSTFVEPIASFTYANTHVGDLTDGTVRLSFDDGQSIRAGAGAKVGTRIGDASGGFVEVSLLGRVWDEFAGDNSVTVTDGGNTDTFVDRSGGVFGEMTGSIDASNPALRFSTYLAGGVQFKPDTLTWNAKVGVRQGF